MVRIKGGGDGSLNNFCLIATALGHQPLLGGVRILPAIGAFGVDSRVEMVGISF